MPGPCVLLLEFLLTHCFRPGLSTAIHYQGQPNTHEPANDARKGLNPEINQYGIHREGAPLKTLNSNKSKACVNHLGNLENGIARYSCQPAMFPGEFLILGQADTINFVTTYKILYPLNIDTQLGQDIDGPARDGLQLGWGHFTNTWYFSFDDKLVHRYSQRR